MRKNLRIALAILFGITGCITSTFAKPAYPEQSIHLVVPGAPGSALDFVARTISIPLGEKLGQSVVIENRPGASGTIGARAMITARPDGYTYGLMSSDYAVNPSLFKSLPYDSIKDISAVTVIGSTPLVLVVPKDSPYKSVQDLILAAKNRPGELTYGTAGNGVIYVAGLMFNTAANISALQIPFKGGNPLITAVIGSQVDYAFLAIPSILGQVNDGLLRPLAITAPERSALLPEVVTLDEAGLRGFDMQPWIALAGPAGLSTERRDIFRNALLDVIRLPKVQQTFSAQGFVARGSTPQQTIETISQDIEAIGKLFKAAKVEPQ